MRFSGSAVGWLVAFGWVLVALAIPAGRAAETPSNAELASHRAAIDELDGRIVSLLNERARHAMAIGEQKRRHQQEPYAPQRERAVLERVSGLNTGPLTDASLRAVYREIMSGSLALEGPPSVAYLGPSATFTHQAARQRFGSGVEYVSCGSVAEVVRAVASGKVNHGVVPFENSTEGAVHPTLDALGPAVGNEGLRAIAEVRLRIVHHLATRASRLDGIRVLYVHPQTRAQCRGWIERNLPGVEVIETPSNARSAELATRNRRSAALCGDFTAQTYGLPLLVSGVQDEGNNTTRFLVLGRTPTPPTGQDRTTLVITARSAGAADLASVLGTLKTAGLPVERVHARPARGAESDGERQRFFLDCPGHERDAAMATALEQIRQSGVVLRVLGSYPVSVD